MGPPKTRGWGHLRQEDGATLDKGMGPPRTRGWGHLRQGDGATYIIPNAKSDVMMYCELFTRLLDVRLLKAKKQQILALLCRIC